MGCHFRISSNHLLVLTAGLPKVSTSLLLSTEDKEEIFGDSQIGNESRFGLDGGTSRGAQDLVDLAEISDDQLSAICKLDSLKSLSFMYTQVSDEGIRILSKLKSLQKLVLHRQSKLTEDGVREIAKLERLRSLWLSSISIESQHLACLSKLKKLRELNLSESFLEDEELDIILSGCEQLLTLDLSRTKIPTVDCSTYLS